MTPKSGKVRAIPLAPAVASALAVLGQRTDWVGDDDLVFVGDAGGYLDGSALRRRYKRALAVGHADVQTTMRYLHYAPREEDARLVAEAFEIESAPDPAREKRR